MNHLQQQLRLVIELMVLKVMGFITIIQDNFSIVILLILINRVKRKLLLRFQMVKAR